MQCHDYYPRANRGTQRRHLVLSLSQQGHPASVPPFPHHHLSSCFWENSWHKFLLTCQAGGFPKYKRVARACNVLCCPSILLSAGQTGQQVAGVQLSTFLPSSSLQSFCTGNKLLPRPRQKDETALPKTPEFRPIACKAQVKSSAVVLDESCLLSSRTQRA